MVRLFSYLKFHPDVGIQMSPPGSSFPTRSAELDIQPWKEQYPNAREELPDDAPTPQGRPMTLTVTYDADGICGCITC